MNTTFLQYVAKDIIAKHIAAKDNTATNNVGNLADIAVVFPNKRASLFLNRALYEEVGRPVWSPAYFTISELFRHHSTLTVPDQTTLIFRLYNIYKVVTGSQETLDHFFSWGQLMLSDFDDIDKNMVDADKLFINLEAWQEMKDFSFLSDRQRESLEEFFGKMIEQTELQKRFNDTWKHLAKIYHTFRKSLMDDQLAYEGMLYRHVVENVFNDKTDDDNPATDDAEYKHYIFVGFNLLQKVEQQLFTQLRKRGMAQFYWDYDQYYMTGQHEAGRYIQQYLLRFPNELSEERASEGIDTHAVYNNMASHKDMSYVSAPTEDIQARYVSSWLKTRNAMYKEGETKSIAIVMADEALLQNVIHAIPNGAGDVNITTGFPLLASPVATLVDSLIALQLYGQTKDARHFRLQYVNRILRHPYAKYISQLCRNIYVKINENKTYFPSVDMLADGADEAIAAIFSPIVAHDGIIDILEWMATVLKFAGIGARTCKDILTQESIFRMYTLIQRLGEIMTVTTQEVSGIRDGKQLVSVNILLRLLNQVVEATSIPFHGEPARGIQVMGVLETRNLDFDHVLLLSANEGNMPRGVNDASFIPHSLRQGYEMTTVENKVAIYSYYFHSLLQRAGDVTITYNASTSDGRKGEMSRFMLQYMVDNDGRDISLLTLQSGQTVKSHDMREVEKTGLVAQRLNALTQLSPTAIGRYLRCPLQFYYYSICGLKDVSDDDENEIDNAIFGNIFHRTAELIYIHLSGEDHSRRIEKPMLEALFKDERRILSFLDQAFREKLFNVSDASFRPVYNGLQLLNRKVLYEYITRLLRYDMLHTPFNILALEKSFSDNVELETPDGTKRTLTLGGNVDRLDMLDNGQVRVVDYKTGKQLESYPSITDIFNPDCLGNKHTDYYLQACLYASIIRRGRNNMLPDNVTGKPVAPALFFIRVASSSDYNPVLKINVGTRKTEFINDINDVYDEYMAGLKRLVSEILNLETPFEPTTEETRCALCPYKYICKT